MEILTYLKAVILGLVEGITEFLPISSTGHLIIADYLMKFGRAIPDSFEIIIQLGAILAVCWFYRARLGAVLTTLPSRPESRRFVINLMIAFLPAAILGVLFIKKIKHFLFNPIGVAAAFIIGGIIILVIESTKRPVRIEHVDDMRWTDALKIGIAQAFSLIPGTSRSGATIMGALLIGMSREAAVEFSFFLAIPTMFAATLYELVKNWRILHASDFNLIAVGFVVAFLSAFIAVKKFLQYVTRHNFTGFAWYRILFGIVVLIWFRHIAFS